MTLPLVPFLSFGQIEGKRTFLACGGNRWDPLEHFIALGDVTFQGRTMGSNRWFDIRMNHIMHAQGKECQRTRRDRNDFCPQGERARSMITPRVVLMPLPASQPAKLKPTLLNYIGVSNNDHQISRTPFWRFPQKPLSCSTMSLPLSFSSRS